MKNTYKDRRSSNNRPNYPFKVFRRRGELRMQHVITRNRVGRKMIVNPELKGDQS